MSKRLKRRIHEICGLISLSKEERVRRAQEILSSNEEKQAICNNLLGTSFKDIEKALKDIISERKPSTSHEKLDDDDRYVEDFFAEKNVKRDVSPIKMVEVLDQDEVNRLIQESTTSKCDDDIRHENASRDGSSTYSPQEVQDLLAGDYYPTKYRNRK